MHSLMSRKQLAALFVLTSLGSFNHLSAQISFSGLGPNAGFATGVSDDGKVVVGWAQTPFYSGYRWTSATGAVLLAPAPGKIASNVFVSGDGTTLTGTDYASSPRVYQWKSSGELQHLDVPAGTVAAYGAGISGDGSTIVGSLDFGNGLVPFHWTQATGTVVIGSGQGNDRGALSGVSRDGSVISGTGVSGAFRWTEATGPVPLGLLGNGSNQSRGMNSDGSVIVGSFFDSQSSQQKSFRWNADDGMVELDNIPEFRNTVPFDVSDDGGIIVGGYDGAGFIWTPNSGMRDLLDVLNHDYSIASQTTGWTFLEPFAVSPDGRYIVGGGNLGGWLLDRGLDAPPIDVGQPPVEPPPFTAVPEPTTYGVFGSFLLLGLAAWQRNKKRMVC